MWMVTQVSDVVLKETWIRPKKIPLLPEMRMTKKILIRAAAKKIFINFTDFFKWSLHLKNFSSSTFLCWKTKGPLLLKEKKCKFVRRNLLWKFFCFCMFFETKNIFSYTLNLSAWVGDKKFFTRSISGNNLMSKLKTYYFVKPENFRKFH